jgi:hypothetical protein
VKPTETFVESHPLQNYNDAMPGVDFGVVSYLIFDLVQLVQENRLCTDASKTTVRIRTIGF